MLVMDDSGLSGTLPTQIGALHELQELKLDKSALSGTIPLAVDGLRSARVFDLDHSGVSGTLPLEIFSLSKLDVLDMDGTRSHIYSPHIFTAPTATLIGHPANDIFQP